MVLKNSTQTIQFRIVSSAGAVEYTDCTLCRGVTPHKCPGYDTKQSDGEVLVMLEL